MSAEEFVPNGLAIWQSDHSRNYYCDRCHRWVFSQNETLELDRIECVPDGHRLVFLEREAD